MAGGRPTKKQFNRARAKIERDYENYEPIPESGCHIWKGYVMPNGYGTTTILGKNFLVHRMAWARANGRMPVGNDVIRHKCDTPCCMNPEHLVIGKQSDNMRDMRERGRGSWQK